MLFSSIAFLYFFLPAMALYFVTPQKFKNAYLLIASLFFYFYGEPIYVSLLIFSSIVDWCHGLYIEANRGTKKAKLALVSSIIINLGLLGFFKYWDFLIGTVNSIFGTSLPLMEIPLPIGISFFTFQTMSYTIDVYRGKAHAQKNFSTFATYVCLFPQLIAGPIVRYTDVESELKDRATSVSCVSEGIIRFCVGLSKKVLIANLFGEVCTIFRGLDEPSVLFYWMYAIAFPLQVYFDFSGYSDMAIGLGKMLGFSFPENFNYPFISRTVTEFWRRWHITLGGWFRDYLYIPLGGNRVSGIKWVRNIAIVWLATGIWHGAAWNFALWGLFFGIVLIAEKLWLLKRLEKTPKWIGHFYTLILVVLSFVIFNGDGLLGVVSDFKGLLGLEGLPFVNNDTIYYLKSYGVVFAVGIIGATPLPKKMWLTLCSKKGLSLLEPIGAMIILVVSTAFIVNGSFNPFLYFRF